MIAVYLAWLVLVGLALAGRELGRSWLNPCAFFPGSWVVVSGFAIAFAPLFPLHPAGVWVIVSMVLAFQVGSLLVPFWVGPDHTRLSPSPGLPASAIMAGRLKAWTLICTALAAVGVIRLLQTGVAQFGLAFTPEVLLRLGGAFSSVRYSGINEIPGGVRAFLYFAYPASLLGGLLFALVRRRAWRALAVAPILVSLVSGLLVAARAGLLLSAVLWAAGFLAAITWRAGGRVWQIKLRGMAVVGGVGLSLLGAYVLFQWIRGGGEGRIDVLFLMQHAAAAVWASTAVFSEWVGHGEPPQLALGAFTFAGVYDLLNLATRERGLYPTAVFFPSGHSSNIYTLFRGLIDDFGLAGAWLACFAGGAGSGLSYYRVTAGHSLWMLPLSAFYAVALFSDIRSPFSFNSIILAWVVAAAVLVWPVGVWTTMPVRDPRTHDA